MSTRLFLPLLSVSTALLTILWVLVMQQLCNTHITEKKRLYRITLLLIFSTFAIFDNGLLYLSSMMPNYELFPGVQLWVVTYTIEAISVMIGFHIFCKCQLAIIHNRYYLVNISPPAWIQFFLRIVETVYIFAVCYCYILLLLLNNLNYAQAFYIVLTGIVFIQCLITLVIFSKLLKHLSELNADKLNIAKHAIRFGIFLCIVICIVCLMSIAWALEFMFSFTDFAFNHGLVDSIFHSLFLSIIIISLYLWIYQKMRLVVGKGTVCHLCGCTDCVHFWCGCCIRKVRISSANHHKKQTNIHHDKMDVLLEESSKQTITEGLAKPKNTTSGLTEVTEHTTSVQSNDIMEDIEPTATNENIYFKS
eukprot:294137_1